MQLKAMTGVEEDRQQVNCIEQGEYLNTLN